MICELYDTTDGGELGVYGQFDVWRRPHPGTPGCVSGPADCCAAPEPGSVEVVEVVLREIAVGACCFAREELPAPLVAAVEKRLLESAADATSELASLVAACGQEDRDSQILRRRCG